MHRVVTAILATSTTALVMPHHRAHRTCRRASDGVEVEDVDDAALAASLQLATKRTSSAREVLEKRRQREARPQRAVDAPQKPTLAVRDSRVKAAMEPQQELRELFDEGSWGALPEGELLTRLGYLFAASFLVTVFLVDFDTYETDLSLADRIFMPMALGSLAPLLRISNILMCWQYVDERLAEEVLYFERTGWNDGFMAQKDPNAAKRDTQARAAQTAPQLAVLRRATAYCAGVAALSTAGFFIL